MNMAEFGAALVLTGRIAKMMFVAGETGEPSTETTSLIEQIVHEQVHEIVGLLYRQMSHDRGLTGASSDDPRLSLLEKAYVRLLHRTFSF